MSFLYPLGLIGLIGIPILIAIYIIKNKYTEQTIASTYLWTLSEKFLKKRLPINKLVGIISLILQILAVLLISLSIAHPVFYLPGAANDYCFVLDGSGSMNISAGETTRFEVAKDEIRALIDGSKNGSAYSLVVVGDTTELVFKDVDDKDRALRLLNGVSQAYTADVFRDALGVAQEIFNGNPSTLTYLFTDKEVENSDNVTVVNISEKEENYAVSSVEYSILNTASGSTVTFSGEVISYESRANLHLGLYLDEEEEFSQAAVIEAPAGEAVPFRFECNIPVSVISRPPFTTARIAITDKDALALDNEVIVYNADYENSYNVLLVSDAPFFIQASLISVGNAVTDVISTGSYSGQEGYDLYIFDSYTPKELPDAAVWFFNPDSSVAKSGFTVDEKTLSESVQIDYNTYASSTLVETLLANVITQGDNSVISLAEKYQVCGFYRGFTTLMSHNGNPLLFAGTNELGNREVVFAFDLKNTNLPVHMNYAVLMKNLLEFTFPTVVESTYGYCGDTLYINVISNCDSIRVVAPISGRISYLNTSGTVAELKLTEVGAYTVILTMNDKTTRYFNIFSALPEEERETVSRQAVSFGLVGEASSERRSGVYDDLLAEFILLSLIFLADWMVYCYEQYQLR